MTIVEAEAEYKRVSRFVDEFRWSVIVPGGSRLQLYGVARRSFKGRWFVLGGRHLMVHSIKMGMYEQLIGAVPGDVFVRGGPPIEMSSIEKDVLFRIDLENTSRDGVALWPRLEGSARDEKDRP